MTRRLERTETEQTPLWPRERPRPEDRPLLACADNLDFMRGLPGDRFKLIVTSPPYNLGKEYESRTPLDAWLETQERVIGECARLLHPQGSICWQVGNFVQDGEIVPL